MKVIKLDFFSALQCMQDFSHFFKSIKYQSINHSDGSLRGPDPHAEMEVTFECSFLEISLRYRFLMNDI